MVAALRPQKSRSASLPEHRSKRKGVERTIEIPARHLLKPHQQGQLDFLCGLYAVINSVRLLRAEIAPLMSQECKTLFAAGSQFLAAKQGLHTALTWGLDLRRRYALTRHIAKMASTDTFQLTVERAALSPRATINQVLAWIDASLSAGKPVLIFFENQPDHYTVATHSSASVLGLFDSAGMSFVRKASLGVGCGSRHIAPNSLLRMSLEPLP